MPQTTKPLLVVLRRSITRILIRIDQLSASQHQLKTNGFFLKTKDNFGGRKLAFGVNKSGIRLCDTNIMAKQTGLKYLAQKVIKSTRITKITEKPKLLNIAWRNGVVG